MDERPLGIHGTRLAEVFNIEINRINNNNNNGFEKCEVYGTIQVEDSQGTVTLYDRSLENAERVYESGSLSLSLIAKQRPIDASNNFQVIFDLKDKSGNEFIKSSFSSDINNSIDTNPVPFNCNEKCRVVEVGGMMGGAVVTYAVYQVGVLACILTHFVKENDNIDTSSSSSSDCECDNVHVHGNLVITHCDNDHDHDPGVKLEDTRVVLFHHCNTEEAVQLNKEDGYEIRLIRDFVVVPAYRSVRVEGDFHIRLSSGLVESIKISQLFPTDNLHRELQKFKGKYGCIRFSLTWRNSFNYENYRNGILARQLRF